MKWMSTLLALYLTALSVWPCHDHPGVALAGRVRVSSQQETTGGPAGHEHPCSPFCACACCGAHLTVPVEFAFTPAPPQWQFIPASPFSYQLSTWVAPPATIWQPPQLA